jgi:hypothetical protein
MHTHYAAELGRVHLLVSGNNSQSSNPETVQKPFQTIQISTHEGVGS